MFNVHGLIYVKVLNIILQKYSFFSESNINEFYMFVVLQYDIESKTKHTAAA